MTGDIARPILRIDAKLHHTMKRRIRPFPDSRHESMFHGIDMNIVDVSVKILFIANRMLPLATLPDTAFAFGSAST